MSCTFSFNSVAPEVELCERLKKMQKLSLTEMNWILLCCFVMLDWGVVHLELQFHSLWGRVVWVSKENGKIEFNRNEELNWILLCCFVMLDWDVVHLHLQFYCSRDWVVWVSKENAKVKCDRNELNLTVLFCNAWLRYLAPSAPISLYWMSSFVSV